MKMDSTYKLPNGVFVSKDLNCPMSDGTILKTDVYRPAETNKYPVLLMRTPYGKDAAQANDVNTYAHPAWFAQSGYIVVVQDVRGRHGSEGTFYPLVNEVSDGFETIEWCTHIPDAQPTVGMYGMSYPGFVQLAAASSGHPALKCIIPGCTSTAADQWALKNGIPRLAFILGWGLGLAHDEAIRQGNMEDARVLASFSRDPGCIFTNFPILGSPETKLLIKYMPFVSDWLTHTDPADHYWTEQHISTASIPALYFAGWYDIWLQETVELFRNQKEEGNITRLVVGPWIHTPWRKAVWPDCKYVSNEQNPSINELHLEWFNWHLKAKKPFSWIAKETSKWFDYGNGIWRQGDFFQKEDQLTLFTGGDGLATVTNNGSLTYSPSEKKVFDVIVSNPLGPTPSVGGWSCCYDALAPIGPKDQSFVENLSQVAVYTTNLSWQEKRLVGSPVLELELSTQLLPMSIVATLCLVRKRRSINISRGATRILDDKLCEEVPFEQDHRLIIEFGPVNITLLEGDQLQLLVSTSCFPELAIDPQSDAPFAFAGPEEVHISTLFLHHGSGNASSISFDLAPAE